MTLDDLDLPPEILALARRYADDLDLSEDVFVDHALEVYGPEDGTDRDRLHAAILAMVERLGEAGPQDHYH